jgi:carbon storage regulator CsrA
MLVLSRKVNEQIVVPQCDLTVTVLDIAGGRVRLGFSAPANLVVMRREVLQRRATGNAGQEMGESCPPARILLADRDPYALASYRDFLRQRGAVVATATTGLACVRELQAFTPDVLVLEAELLWGGGDGVLAVLDEEPELRPAVVILVSYAADRGLMHRVSRFKVDDYQMKPITAARLGSRIIKLLGPRGTPAEPQAVPA